jgi:hypothetical protein
MGSSQDVFYLCLLLYFCAIRLNARVDSVQPLVSSQLTFGSTTYYPWYCAEVDVMLACFWWLSLSLDETAEWLEYLEPTSFPSSIFSDVWMQFKSPKAHCNKLIQAIVMVHLMWRRGSCEYLLRKLSTPPYAVATFVPGTWDISEWVCPWTNYHLDSMYGLSSPQVLILDSGCAVR